MIVDSHCHLGHLFDAEERAAAVGRAREAGVTRMVTLATQVANCADHQAFAEAHEGVFFCAGVHPSNVHEAPDDFEEGLRPFLDSPKCVAVGETGLDYYHPAPEGWTDEAFRARQQDFLRRHFELAVEAGKNVVIHTRDRKGKASLDDAVAVYGEYAGQVKAVFHCFIGPWENAGPVLELGGLVSFTGIATFKNAKDVLASAVAAPAGSVMVETDSPYLAPMPFRGKPCEPAYTRLTAEHIAAARGEAFEDFARHTTATAEAFYGLPVEL